MTAEAKQRRRYELLGGVHYEPNPNWKPSGNSEYDRMDPDRMVKFIKKPNEMIVVESDRRLDQIYANKFRDLAYANGPVTELRRAQVEELLKSNSGFSEEDRIFLESLDGDGFNRILRMAAMKQDKTPQGEASPIFGEDVTHQFQQAYDGQFKVYRNAQGKHNVLRGASKKPLNKAPLNQENVEEFVAQYLKETR